MFEFETITVYGVYYTDWYDDDITGYECNENYEYFWNHDDAIKCADEINSSDDHWLNHDAKSYPMTIHIPKFTNNPATQRHSSVIDKWTRIAQIMHPLWYFMDDIKIAP